MIRKIDKKELLKYLTIIGITLLLCHNFLQMHYSSDTYVLYDLGYLEYPSKYFLVDGRLISTLACYTANFLELPIHIYIRIMNFLGIIFLGTSIYLASRMLEKMIKPQNSMHKIIIIASCFVLILNQFVLEYLLFPESAVMCLGVLLNVIAVNISLGSSKHKYIKIFLTLLLAGICYQALLNIFPVLVIAMHIVKQLTDEREYKIKEKEFFIEMIKLAIIALIVVVMCMCIIKVVIYLLDSSQDRMMHLTDVGLVIERTDSIIRIINETWNYNLNMLPKHSSTIILCISFILLVILKTKKEMLLQYILLIIMGFAVCFLPMYIFNTGACGRVNIPLMMLWGLSLIILLAQDSINEFGVRKNIIYIFVIVSFIINSIFFMQNSAEHIASNCVEENMGRTIKLVLDRYEEQTGITVTKFGYAYDINPQYTAVGIKNMGSLTERKLACPWSVSQTINFYCERKFEVVRMPIENYVREIYGYDYKEFTEEQIIFEDDAMYLIIY